MASEWQQGGWEEKPPAPPTIAPTIAPTAAGEQTLVELRARLEQLKAAQPPDQEAIAALEAQIAEMSANDDELAAGMTLGGPDVTSTGVVPDAGQQIGQAVREAAETTDLSVAAAQPTKRPWWVTQKAWDGAGSPEAQATIAQTGQQLAIPLALTVAQIGLGWRKTEAETATEDIRDKYQPGREGKAAVEAFEKVAGSTAGAAQKLMKDTMHTLFAAKGQTGAAYYTQAARESARFGMAEKTREDAAKAQIFTRAEEMAKTEYMQALATPTAKERRLAQLGQVLSGSGILPQALGALAGAKGLRIAAPALAQMTPEQRLIWTEAIGKNPALAYELMARQREGTPATATAATAATPETPA